MNFIKKIALFAMLLTIEQASYSSASSLAHMQMHKNTGKNYKDADQLIAESYVTPEMQWAVFQFMEKPFVINKTTGVPVYSETESVPSVDEILSTVTPSTLSNYSKDITLKALQAALSAIKTATFVAALEAAYDINKKNYYWYQTADGMLTDILNYKKNRIEQMIATVTRATTSKGSVSSASSTVKLVNKNYMIISPEMMDAIIAANNFKTLAADPNNKVNIQEAATLLFKGCVIAQKNIIFPENWIKPALESGYYIFSDAFPNMDQLINFAKSKQTPGQKHELLKSIRQAVQTALFIAKQNSTYYVTTDPLVQVLKDMDARVSKVYMDRAYGATDEDLNRAGMWSNLTNIAAGAAVVGAAGAAYYASQNPDDVKAIAQQAQDFVGKQTEHLSRQASDTQAYLSKQASDVQEYVFGTPTLMDQAKNKTTELKDKAIGFKNELQQNTTELLNKLGVDTSSTKGELLIPSVTEPQYTFEQGIKNVIEEASEEHDLKDIGRDRTWEEWLKENVTQAMSNEEALKDRKLHEYFDI